MSGVPGKELVEDKQSVLVHPLNWVVTLREGRGNFALWRLGPDQTMVVLFEKRNKKILFLTAVRYLSLQTS